MSIEPSHRTKGTSICEFYYSNPVNELFVDNDCDLNTLSEAHNLEKLPKDQKDFGPQVILPYQNLRS